MKNSLAMVRNAFFIMAFVVLATTVSTWARAGEVGSPARSGGDDTNVRGVLSDHDSENAPHSMGFIISLTRSLSLDLKLGSVDTGQTPTAQKQLGSPPIPLPKAPGYDLRYSRLGVGFSIGF